MSSFKKLGCGHTHLNPETLVIILDDVKVACTLSCHNPRQNMTVISHRTVEHDAVGKRLLLGQVSAIYQLDRESVLIVGLAPKRI